MNSRRSFLGQLIGLPLAIKAILSTPPTVNVLSTWSGNCKAREFADHLIRMTPHYDKAILRDFRGGWG